MSTLAAPKPSTVFPSAATRAEERDIAIDYLRPFVIVLVIFLHAALAYASFSTFNPTRYADSSARVVDASRWPVIDQPILYFDTFMMSLLFLVSGLFTMSGLERRGSGGFFRARWQRLGIPFVVSAIFIAPLAFWPSYLLSTPETNSPYLATFYTSDGWPVGAPWFLWVLLAFNGMIAFVHWKAPGVLDKLRRPPTALVILLVSLVAFVPVSLFIPVYAWVSVGPFDAQPARLGLYLAYYLLGVALGTGQQWRATGWPGRWGLWLTVGVVSFVAYMGLMNSVAVPLPGFVAQALRSTAFAASCAGTSLGLLGAFRQFAPRRHPIFDNLSTNSYGIYIVHYALVTWIQFALLPAAWPAWVKFMVSFAGGLTLSWGTSHLLRQIPAVRRVL